MDEPNLNPVSSQGRTRSVETQMKHLNGNCLCAIWIETTGEDPRKCDIVEICIYLLDNFLRPSPAMVPFYQMIKPYRRENIDPKAMTINKQQLQTATLYGVEPTRAADLLEEWMLELNMKQGKKIVPLAYNWPKVSEYLHTWLGFHNFNFLFSEDYRDIRSSVLTINDLRNQQAEVIPYPRPEHIAYIGALSKVPFRITSDVMEKCIKLSEIYRQVLVNRF